ncbi:LAMI_0C07712g1_1 [Lachancea mirantina]|uniref:LAMI_0C07712g1_1 n=1 Tax=Lachancea mirantina TaxID=1230905 RepID=A0A1G4J475_9SACH|nr:LAMI_0C07712g1_1 [Lachancea mirantina]
MTVILWPCLIILFRVACVRALELRDGSNELSEDIVNNPFAAWQSKIKMSSNSILNSDLLTEWTPVKSVIYPGKRDYFNFEVNSSSSAFTSGYEMLIFLSGNICSQTGLNNSQAGLRVSHGFNDSVVNHPGTGHTANFSDGYMEGLAIRPLKDGNASTEYSTLYLVVEMVNTTTGEILGAELEPNTFWNYTISVSQNDLVYQWDARTWLDVVDTDYNSALLVTGNVTGSSPGSSNYSIFDTSLYDLYVYSYDYMDYFDDGVKNSICAIQNGPWQASSVNGTTSSQNTEDLSITDLTIVKNITIRGGSVKEQFYITGLNSSTTYVAYLTKKLSSSGGKLSDYGGILFSKSTFTTMSNNSCSLIFNLDFCDGVAYSVPTSSYSPNNKSAIAQSYDGIASSLYGNFSKALQIIPCDSEEDARYSPLKTCQDCDNAYRNWLCAVSIPRCTTENTSYYIPRTKEDNRNDYINENIRPISSYYEVLPCIDMCYTLVADCPAAFGFACPSSDHHPQLFYQSYNFYEKEESFDSCNFVGNSENLRIL